MEGIEPVLLSIFGTFPSMYGVQDGFLIEM